MPKLDLVFFDAGGGHRAAATALKLSLEQQFPAWNVRLMNLQETLDELDVIRRISGVRMQDVYNQLLRKGWTLGSELLIGPMHLLIRMNHPAMVRSLAERWGQDAPDLLVSLVPNFNRVLFDGYRRVRPEGQMVTILTDLADFPPHFWIEQQDQWFVCGTQRAVDQALAAGHPPERVRRASGMILHPSFYQEFPPDRAADRRRIGLRDDLPTGLVLFGGFGSMRMIDIAERIAVSDLEIQLIFVCGRNERLRTKLAEFTFPRPAFVEGFTTDVPHYMRLADFFIGKPGPGSISEAIHMKLPVIVERNSWTLPQERYNTEWVEENKVGVVVPNFDGIVDAIRKLPIEEYRANAARLVNRAVFEIPGMLAEILERGETREG